MEHEEKTKVNICVESVKIVELNEGKKEVTFIKECSIWSNHRQLSFNICHTVGSVIAEKVFVLNEIKVFSRSKDKEPKTTEYKVGNDKCLSIVIDEGIVFIEVL